MLLYIQEMDNIKNKEFINSKELYIELFLEKFKSVMDEVNRQVQVYEEREKSGKLTPPPTSNPLFGK